MPVSDNPAYKLHKIENHHYYKESNTRNQLMINTANIDELFADFDDIEEVHIKYAKDESDIEDGYETVECYL